MFSNILNSMCSPSYRNTSMILTAISMGTSYMNIVVKTCEKHSAVGTWFSAKCIAILGKVRLNCRSKESKSVMSLGVPSL